MTRTRPLTELQALLRSRGQLRPGAASETTSGPSARPFGLPSSAVTSGWTSVDRELFAGSSAGLVRGSVHEWFGIASQEDSGGPGGTRGAIWSPPLFVLTHLARRAIQNAFERGAPTHVVWIGRQVWPYPRVLEDDLPIIERAEAPSRATDHELEFELGIGAPAGAHAGSPPGVSASPSLLERSLFVDPGDVGKRLWAIDTALRCGSVTAVIADGSGLGMASTRRLQLAAQAAEALVLLARPPSEVGEISAATTRWRVSRVTGDGAAGEESGPLWRAELLRAKGAQELRRHRPGEQPAAASRSA